MLMFLLCSCSLIETEESGKKTEENNSKVPEPTVGESSENTFKFSDGYFNEKDICGLFNMSREQIEFNIGTDYEIELTGAEESLTLYTYSKHDISISYYYDKTEDDTTDDEVEFVLCGENIDFYGVHIGMTYNEIKEIIPNVTIKKYSPEEDKDIVYYELEFFINNMKIYAVVADEISPTTSMEIYRN